MPREGRKTKRGWYTTTQGAMPRKRCCSTASLSGGPSATINSGRMNGRWLCFLQFGWVVLALRLSCCPAFTLHPSSVQVSSCMIQRISVLSFHSTFNIVASLSDSYARPIDAHDPESFTPQPKHRVLRSRALDFFMQQQVRLVGIFFDHKHTIIP